MNQVNKLRSLFKKSKFSIRNIIFVNKESLFFGTSLLGLCYVGYTHLNNNSLSILQKSFCKSAFPQKIQYIHEWTNMPESVRNKDIIRLEDLKKEKTEDDKNEVQDKKLVPVIFETEQDNKTVNGLPVEVPYLIIGAGIAGISAARAIRASDPFAKVLIINSECQSPGPHHESYPPYKRILLSKFIWRRSDDNQKSLLDTSGDVKTSSMLYVEPDSFFVSPANLNKLEYGGISLVNNTRVASINPQESIVVLEGSGHKITYMACLIATGSYPKRLKHLELSGNTGKDLYREGKVTYFRSLNDFRNLLATIKQLQTKENGGRLLIVGSGLLGTELTSSLGRLAKYQGKLEVIEVFKEKSHLHHLLPEELSLYIQKHIANDHTKLVSQSEVTSIDEVVDGPDSGRLNINIKSLSDKEENKQFNEMVDHVVIAAGVKPETSLSIDSHLETDQLLGGFLVNAELQAREGIFIAGDACSFYDPILGRRRVEHWNHSEESGTIAGHNMAAFVLKTNKTQVLDRFDQSKLANDILKPKIYDYQSSFSFTLSMSRTIEALGLIDSSLETKTFIAQEFFDQEDEEAKLKEKGDKANQNRKEDKADQNRKEDKADQDQKEDKVDQNRKEDNVVALMHDKLDMPGVVFYLRCGKIVGILLWNCDDDIVIENTLPSPLRTNVARKILSERSLITSDDDLKRLAADFDLSFFVNNQVRIKEERLGADVNEIEVKVTELDPQKQ